MIRPLAFAAAAALVAVIWLGIWHFVADGPGMGAFAQTVEQIQKAKSITWRITYYNHITSKDGKRAWVETEKHECAYKAPGLYREATLDEKGQIRWVHIEDTPKMRQLTWDPNEKRATLTDIAVDVHDSRMPFVWVKKDLEANDLQWVEKRRTAAGEVNIFRHAFRDNANGRDWSIDFWIDQKTKQLVELHNPGADIFDPDTDPARNNSPEKEWSTGTIAGSIQHDIIFDVVLDDSLFRLEPPEGYALETKTRPHVTEQEMIDYLGILADYNDKAFPDQVFPYAFSSDRLNKSAKKPKKDRTAAEQELLDANDRYKMAGLYLLPIGQFVQDSTVENSFRYLGKGVKLGDKDRIVCWYKPKGAATYRVVYGDLTVKDLPPEALPLPVEP